MKSEAPKRPLLDSDKAMVLVHGMEGPLHHKRELHLALISTFGLFSNNHFEEARRGVEDNTLPTMPTASLLL
jgi:hypothetical protein